MMQMETRSMKATERARLVEALKAAAKAVGNRLEYYAETEEGRQALEENLRRISFLIMYLTGVALDITRNVVTGVVRRLGNYIAVGNMLYEHRYKDAGKKVFNVEKRCLQSLGYMAGESVATVYNGVKVAKDSAQGKTMDAGEKSSFFKGVRNCLVAAGTIAVAVELTDMLDNDAAPLIDVEHLPGVENGMLIYHTPENINVLAVSGELDGTEHISDYVRDDAVKAEFLAMHGFSEQPAGWEVHHIVPLSEGGADSVENMVLVREDDHAEITAQHARFYHWH